MIELLPATPPKCPCATTRWTDAHLIIPSVQTTQTLSTSWDSQRTVPQACYPKFSKFFLLKFLKKSNLTAFLYLQCTLILSVIKGSAINPREYLCIDIQDVLKTEEIHPSNDSELFLYVNSWVCVSVGVPKWYCNITQDQKRQLTFDAPLTIPQISKECS